MPKRPQRSDNGPKSNSSPALMLVVGVVIVLLFAAFLWLRPRPLGTQPNGNAPGSSPSTAPLVIQDH